MCIDNLEKHTLKSLKNVTKSCGIWVGPIRETWCFHNKANSNKHKLFCWPHEDLAGATVLPRKHSLSRTLLLGVGDLVTAAMGLLCI